MTINVAFDIENKIVTGKLIGKVDRSTLREYTIEMEETIIKEKCSLVLSDYREADFQLSTLDLFRIPERHSKLLKELGGNIHSLKRALIFSKNDIELATFFENVAVNRGQKVKIFFEATDALAWLINE